MLLNNKKNGKSYISFHFFFVRQICYYGNINAATSAMAQPEFLLNLKPFIDLRPSRKMPLQFTIAATVITKFKKITGNSLL